jgi:hypothetical protein
MIPAMTRSPLRIKQENRRNQSDPNPSKACGHPENFGTQSYIYAAGPDYKQPALACQENSVRMSEASKLSGFVARNQSGLLWSPLEVTDETDRDAAGDPEDAI